MFALLFAFKGAKMFVYIHSGEMTWGSSPKAVEIKTLTMFVFG